MERPSTRPGLSTPSAQYYISAKFRLYEHETPTRPEGDWEDLLFSEDDLALELQPNGRLENCRRHTVQPASPHSSFEVVLEQPLATGLADLRYAQVWKVRCASGRTLVARFYDPLYVDDDSQTYDIFKHIDRAIALEAFAYHALEDLQGVIVPRFVGSFLTLVAASQVNQDKRSVQVVLLEFIPGCDLARFDSGDVVPVCDMHKMAVIDAALIAAYLFALRGIRHLDLTERNIILKDEPHLPSPPPFCSDSACRLRFRCPSESLIQTLNTPGQPEFDYSTLTSQQLNSLPIAVIDFEYITPFDELMAESDRIVARWGGQGFTKESLLEAATPEQFKSAFLATLDKWRH
ncbi:hypothetical protein C8R46DRAFT_183293 [Mycena filopes]|nr:hypothetical protein C8R46DRAFT_183293 [Mycena filopes]